MFLFYIIKYKCEKFPQTAQDSNRPIIFRLLWISLIFEKWSYDSYRPAFLYDSGVKDNIKQFSVNWGSLWPMLFVVLLL